MSNESQRKACPNCGFLMDSAWDVAKGTVKHLCKRCNRVYTETPNEMVLQ